MNYNVAQAFKLARWLIEAKGKKRTTAYIIAARKHDVDNWHEVQKVYNLYLKERQLKLI
jgi:hypothetical protein